MVTSRPPSTSKNTGEPAAAGVRRRKSAFGIFFHHQRLDANTRCAFDQYRIVVGHHSNIQHNAVLHLADDFACVLGNWVTVGHSAVVHACQVGDEVLIGMGAVILDGAVIGKQSIIGAKALVTQGTKIIRKLTKEERAGLKWWA